MMDATSQVQHPKLSKYEDRLRILDNVILELQTKHNRYYWYRLISFVLLCALVIFAYSLIWYIAIPVFMVGIYAFGQLISIHESITSRLQQVRLIQDLNKDEINQISGIPTSFSSGEIYRDIDHPYSADLDIFGPFSLYQLINRCNTIFGQNKLAYALKTGYTKHRHQDLHEAIDELENKLIWRQEFYSYTRTYNVSQKETSSMISWMSNHDELSIKNYIFLIPILCFIIFILITYYISFNLALLSFIPSAYYIYKNKHSIDKLHAAMESHVPHIKNYSNGIKHIEQSTFHTPFLQKIQTDFQVHNGAAHSINKLAYYLSQLNIRYNFFGIVLNLFTFWEFYWARKILTWKEDHRTLFPTWIDNLAIFELVSSYAGFSFNNPHMNFPIKTKENVLSLEDVYHPFIPFQDRVSNSISMSTQHQIKIITGSNMGGKTTFLRTVGINIILAKAGSKICGKDMKYPDIEVVTSMRTQDSLQESTSSFYAELKRLQVIIETVKHQKNTFYLLDELLKGTNTRDRHVGNVSLIKQLIKHPSSGLISTHDLRLGLLEQQYPNNIENLCFNVNIAGDELSFDYKLRKGISDSFNASHLMKKMGISIIDSDL